MPLAIRARELTKRFPKPNGLIGVTLPFAQAEGTLAVDRVSLDVEQGEVFGLVGPNGAGKTTLVKMLTTLILPTSGTAVVGGHPLDGAHEQRIKGWIGLVTGNERSFYPRLSCRENLAFYAGLYDLSRTETAERVAELAELLDLGGFLDKRYDTCSTGMKHRLALARSLINRPALLFLDEPTRSLDPLAAARFRQAIHALARRERRTVFLVTHDLEEAVGLSDRVGVMLDGRLRVVDTPSSLREVLRPEERCSLRVRGVTPELREGLDDLEDVERLETDARGGDERSRELTAMTLQLRDGRGALPAVMRVIADAGGSVEELRFEGASWEEAFESLDDGLPTAADERREDTGPTLGGRRSVPEEDTDDAAEAGASGWVARPSGGGLRAAVQWLSKPLLFFQRDLKTQTRYRLSFVLQFLGILFSSASFYFVAELFGGNAAPLLGSYGGDYFSFVLIGIAFVGYQGVALYTFSSVIQSAQSLGTLEAMLVTPTGLPTILFSSSLWSFAFTSLRVVVYLVLGGAVFGADLGQANVLTGLVILVLTVVTLSAIGILSACFIMVFKRGSPINFLIGSLSSLLAGVYYPVEVLPGWLQRLARLFPLTYSLEAMRRALLTGEGLVELARPVGALALFSAALLPVSLVAFRYAVRQAKRDGSLTHY